MAVIALIGLRGVGKSTVGELLAPPLGARFVDLDAELAELSAAPGESAGAFLARVGEEAFRAAELSALSGVLGGVGADETLVLACGGGVVETPAARELLGAVLCVWLQAPDEVRGQYLFAARTGKEVFVAVTGRPQAVLAQLQQRLRQQPSAPRR